jgi:Cohesin domain
MHQPLLKIRLWLIISLLVLTLVTSCAPSVASTDPTVKIEPSASSVQINDTIRVSIKSGNLANLTAFETHLSFDAKILEVVEVIDGNFVTADFTVQNTFDNASGTVDYAIAQINREPAAGSGILFEIVLRAKAKGDSPIHFRGTEAAPAGILLSDPNGVAIEVSLIDGSVSVK